MKPMIRIALAVALHGLAGSALADGPRLPRDIDPAWLAECGTCHVAYPPALLTPENWRQLMAGLGRHFGTDASVDVASAARIGAFLERNASRRGARNAATSQRITDTPWFRHEHDEVPAATWRDPAVKTASNCAACHPGADRGRYGEHDISLPIARR